MLRGWMSFVSMALTLISTLADAVDVADSCDQTALVQQHKFKDTRSLHFEGTSSHSRSPGDGEAVVPFNQRLQELDARQLLKIPKNKAKDWNSSRDLATLGPVQNFTWTPEPGVTYQLLFYSAVPSFGEDGNFIALLHDLWADSNPDDFLVALKKFPLYCSGKGKPNRTQLKVYSWEHGEKGQQVSVNFICEWPENQSALDHFKVFVEDESGQVLGSLVAEHKPQLFEKPYGTVACVREVFCTNQSNAPLKLLPEWMEYHAMHGVDHFFVYTFDDSDPGMEAVLTPYINSNLATRIHFKQYPERHVRHHRLMTDCLYRTKNRATWLLPTVDTDEYLHADPKVFKGQVPTNYMGALWDGMLDYYQATRQEVHSINFEFYRFSRSMRHEVEISSILRDSKNNKNNEGRTKFAVNVKLVHGIWIHNPTNWKDGTYAIVVPKNLLCGNHYRYEDHVMYGENDTTVSIEDHSLTSEVEPLKEALKKRYGLDSTDFLKTLSFITPQTDIQILAERRDSGNSLDPLDEATFQQDEKRRAAATDNVGAASLYKEVKSKVERLIRSNYSGDFAL